MKTALIGALLLVFALPTSRPALAQRFTQTNLVSDLSGQALLTDPNLVNPWGLAPSAGGVFWASNNGTSTSTLYNPDGTIRPLVVTIPGGVPTGVVATSAADSAFDIPNGATTARAVFIFVSQSGTISAWNPTVNMTNAISVATDPEASYTGAALGGTRIDPLLYAANFGGGKIEVYDSSFVDRATTGTFTDPGLPANYYPFNIANIGGQLYVAFAERDGGGDEVPGAGLGFVSVFDLQGNFVRRLVSQGELNAPWAIVQAPAGFGPFAGRVLVGNFGDGRVLAYDPGSGAFQGALQDTLGNPIHVSGLWGLAFGRPVSGAEVAKRLYFVAGIGGEAHGLFGYFAAVRDTTPPIACDGNHPRDLSFWRKLCGGGGGDDGDDDDDGHGDGEGGGGDDLLAHHGLSGADSLGALFACIGAHPAPNAFGAGGCFIAGCDLLRPVQHQSDRERAAQILLLARLNLCAGDVCDTLRIRCHDDEGDDDQGEDEDEGEDGGGHDHGPVINPLTIGQVADSLDALLCGSGDRDRIQHLSNELRCALDNEGDDDDNDQGDNHDSHGGRKHRIACRTTGVNPIRLGDGPVHFAVDATVPAMVQLRVYDVRGRLVAEPMHSSMVIGTANVKWDGTNFSGRAVTPGTYFYRAVTTGEAATGRFLIVR